MPMLRTIQTCLYIAFFATTCMAASAETASSQSEKPEPPTPKPLYQAACPVALSGQVQASSLPPIEDDECGTHSPLSVTHVNGVKLSSPVTLNCRMTTALADWISGVQFLAVSELGSELTSLNVSTSYQCRRRNNLPNGKISEHGFANALDITGFKFSDGNTVTLLDNWVDSEQEATEARSEALFLRKGRDQACNYFTTVLSPDTNKLHKDHFHFDLGCHGKKCTYKLCE